MCVLLHVITHTLSWEEIKVNTKKRNVTRIALGAAAVTAATTVGITAHADKNTANNQVTDTSSVTGRPNTIPTNTSG